MQLLRKKLTSYILISGICFLSFGCSTLKGKNYSSLGTSAFAKKDYSKAVEYFEKAIGEDRDNTGYLTLLGWAYFKAGQYDQAISTFKELAMLDHEAVDAYTGQGWSHFKKLMYDQGIVHFKEAIAIDPESSDAFAGLGWCHFKKGSTIVAKRYFNRALKKGMMYREGSNLKTEPEAHRGLGYLYFSLGDYKKALHHYKIATQHMPEWNDARVKWADCLYTLKKYDDAISVYQQALKHAETADLYDKIGWSYFYLEDKSILFGVKHRNYKKAKKMFNKALEVFPNYASSLSGLAAIEKNM